MIDNETLIGRILLTILLSGLIGLERKFYHKPAGFRTNIMVGLGSSLLMIMGLYVLENFNPGKSVDITHLAGQIVTGIGFLGAGAIIQGRGSIHGLTTAAGIWVVAAIGMMVGLGFYFAAITATIATLLVLIVMGRIEHYIEQRFGHHTPPPQNNATQ
ncbi:MAG: MgtC/SapB family protein [Patescibacteria group bacterium]|nr:MgtC/SapB family protein [Patescibacteria group bacterium]